MTALPNQTNPQAHLMPPHLHSTENYKRRSETRPRRSNKFRTLKPRSRLRENNQPHNISPNLHPSHLLRLTSLKLRDTLTSTTNPQLTLKRKKPSSESNTPRNLDKLERLPLPLLLTCHPCSHFKIAVKRFLNQLKRESPISEKLLVNYH